MPNRLIRDGLLQSEAVLSVPVEARWLYVTILLSADDVGLFEATPFKLARNADIRREHLDGFLEMLADKDLVRLYEVKGRRFGFIPLFGQRLQIKRIKHAAPPDELLADEPDTLSKIKHLARKTTVDSGGAAAAQRKPTVAQPPEPEPEPEIEGVVTTAAAAKPKTAPASPSPDTGPAVTRNLDKPRPARKCPPDFDVTASMVAWAGEKVPGLSLASETDKFRDHTFKTAISDWPGAWRNWMRRAHEDRRPRRGAEPEFIAERKRSIDVMTGGLWRRPPAGGEIIEEAK
jgi:hypothetical protein